MNKESGWKVTWIVGEMSYCFSTIFFLPISILYFQWYFYWKYSLLKTALTKDEETFKKMESEIIFNFFNKLFVSFYPLNVYFLFMSEIKHCSELILTNLCAASKFYFGDTKCNKLHIFYLSQTQKKFQCRYYISQSKDNSVKTFKRY